MVSPVDRYVVRNIKGRYCNRCRKVHDYLTADCVPVAYELERAMLVSIPFGGVWEQAPDGVKVVLG